MTKIKTTLACGLLALALLDCSSQKPAALVVAVSSEVRVPDDVDTLEVTVAGEGSDRFHREYTLGTHGDAALPGTITVYDDQLDPSNPVTITVTARLHDGESRVVRTARAKFVDERQKLLRMPLRFGCLDFPKVCGEDETCKAGACEKNDVDTSAAPDFSDELVFPTQGKCFDRSACVPADATVELTQLFLKRDDCSVMLDEVKALQGDGAAKPFAPTALNVGFVWKANTSGKWTAIDYDAEEGWQIVDEGGGKIVLARGLCDALQGRLTAPDGSNLVQKAIGNPACPPKPPTMPECPPK